MPKSENNVDTTQRGMRKSKGVKILKGCAIGVVACAALVFCGLLTYIRVSYASFYSKAYSEFQIPGLEDGFVPQDLAYSESGDAWLFSGYNTSDFSPIWRRNADGTSTCIKIIEANGNTYHGHGGGLALSGEFAYLTCENGYMVLPAKELLEASDGSEVQAIDKIEVGFDPAFINMQNNVLYTGVFYYEGPYDTPDKMHLTSPDGTQNHAVMYAYEIDPAADYGVASRPFAVYSIPDKVQGIALDANNNFVFSTSWGIVESVFPIYSTNDLKSEQKYDVDGEGVGLFFMEQSNLVDQIKAPPMMEGIVYHDGKIWMSNESASNKYFFGKLIAGGTVYSLEM